MLIAASLRFAVGLSMLWCPRCRWLSNLCFLQWRIQAFSAADGPKFSVVYLWILTLWGLPTPGVQKNSSPTEAALPPLPLPLSSSLPNELLFSSLFPGLPQKNRFYLLIASSFLVKLPLPMLDNCPHSFYFDLFHFLSLKGEVNLFNLPFHFPIFVLGLINMWAHF